MMAAHPASLVLLISLTFGVTEAIRTLKEGPMIDAEGREFKSATFRADAESGPQHSDGSTVHVRCTEASMIIEVKADLYKNGRPVSPGELFLGEAEHWQSSQCRAVAVGDEYIIEVALQDCGSTLTVSEDSVIYSNKLIISPAAGYHAITRVTRAVVPVSCHYKRTHFVSSGFQQPRVTFSTSAKHPAGSPDFSLRLMNDDWTSGRVSNVFFLGDPLHLEASYTGSDSERGRLFVDSCVATLSPDAASVPRYYFIENHGCLIDAKEGASNALFHPRTSASSLQLQLGAFLFQQDSRNTIFITCQLKVTSEMWKSSNINKVCNYTHSRWKNVDGSDELCRCCDGNCHVDETNQRHRIPEDIATCGTVTLGPLMIFPSK